jgi:tetratricopeptide (TPR) repeat protein
MAIPMSTMSRLDKLLKILALEPGDAFTLYGVAQEYAKLGQADRAISFYDQCLAADPNYCYAYYHKAKVQADNDDPTSAAATLRAGIEVAKKAGDGKAQNEMASLLDSIT